MEFVSAETINSFLKPLKLRLCKHDDGWSISALEHNGSVFCKFADSYGYLHYAKTSKCGDDGLRYMLMLIMTTKRWVFDSYLLFNGYNNVDNPYFGNSLEEMLVKRDLIDA